jgi:hypothetical protein
MPTADKTEMLLEFLRDHDTPCPVCGYNVRALTTPRCPECGQTLELKVGAKEPRIAAYIVLVTALSLAAGCGLLACILLPASGGTLHRSFGVYYPVFGSVATIPLAIAALVIRRRFMKTRAGGQWALAILACAWDASLVLVLFNHIHRF